MVQLLLIVLDPKSTKLGSFLGLVLTIPAAWRGFPQTSRDEQGFPMTKVLAPPVTDLFDVRLFDATSCVPLP